MAGAYSFYNTFNSVSLLIAGILMNSSNNFILVIDLKNIFYLMAAMTVICTGLNIIRFSLYGLPKERPQPNDHLYVPYHD